MFLPPSVIATVGANLLRVRKERGLGRPELVARIAPFREALGVISPLSVMTLQMLELGRRAALTDGELKAIAGGLGVHQRTLTRRRRTPHERKQQLAPRMSRRLRRRKESAAPCEGSPTT